MTPARTQNLQNHRRIVPVFHVVGGALVALNFIHAARGLMAYSTDRLYAFLLAVALLIMFWYMRQFPITVQDRVIRLEMRLRLQKLAPDLVGRFDELRVQQVTALRFAGDDELPALTGEVLAGRLTAPAEIKRRIKNWQPDELRA